MRRSALYVMMAGFGVIACFEVAAAPAAADSAPVAAAAEKKSSKDPMEEWRASLTDKQRQRLDAYLRYEASFQEKLRSSADPRDWVLAAQGMSMPGSSHSGQDDDLLVRNAASAAPGDKLVQWVAASAGAHGADSCSLALPRPEAVSALQALEPDNGAAWALSLDAAVQAKDDASIDDVLLHVAAAPRFDTHLIDATTAWISAYEKYGIPDWSVDDADDEDERAIIGQATPATMRFSLAEGKAMAMAPHLNNLVAVCRAPKQATGGDWSRAGLCEEVGRHIANIGTTVVNVHMGLAVIDSAGRTQPADRERRREMQWLREVPLTETAQILALEAAWRASGNEIQARRQVLQSVGYGAQPPAGWMSRIERYQQAMAAQSANADDEESAD